MHARFRDRLGMRARFLANTHACKEKMRAFSCLNLGGKTRITLRKFSVFILLNVQEILLNRQLAITLFWRDSQWLRRYPCFRSKISESKTVNARGDTGSNRNRGRRNEVGHEAHATHFNGASVGFSPQPWIVKS